MNLVKRPLVGVGVIVVKEGRVLLGLRKGSHGSGCWAFPGGHLEYKESVEECTRRELLEETGLKALSCRLGPWVSDIIEDKHYITLFAIVEEFEGELTLMEPHKCEGWSWHFWDAMPSPLFSCIESLKACKERSQYEPLRSLLHGAHDTHMLT